MSHKVQSKETTMTAANSDCVEEALKEAFPDAQILKDEIAQIGRRMRCAYVVRRKNGYDIGIELKDSDEYEVHMYEPGYGSGRKRINDAMRATRIAYNKALVKKMLRKNPQLANMKMHGGVGDRTIMHNGKKVEMKHIQLRSTGLKSKKGKKNLFGSPF